jgi:hypothetical protein
MRIILFFCCAFFYAAYSYSQDKIINENKAYRTYTGYLNDSNFITFCPVKKVMNKKVNYLKIKCGNTSSINIWGINYEEEVWIKDKERNKYYYLKKDSLGFYYDVYNTDDVSWTFVGVGIASGLASGIALIPYDKPVGGISNVILRYRQETVTNEFYPYGFPNLKPSKVIYYFTKHSKDETDVNIEINKKIISLKKGSYYEEITPARPPHSKIGVCLEEFPKQFKIKIYPAQTSVILLSRDKMGLIKIENMNQEMVREFLKRKDKLEKVNP